MIYATGYTSRTPEALERLLNQLDAKLVDIRLFPQSRIPHWEGSALSAQLGRERYIHIRSLGNKNFSVPGMKIEISDLDRGTIQLKELSSHGNLLLLCACKELAYCHRNVVMRHLQHKGMQVQEVTEEQWYKAETGQGGLFDEE